MMPFEFLVDGLDKHYYVVEKMGLDVVNVGGEDDAINEQ